MLFIYVRFGVTNGSRGIAAECLLFPESRLNSDIAL
jgi:hypothetical protein